MSLTYTVRPISDRTAFTGPPDSGSRTPFDASWSSTTTILGRELDALRARNVVMELDVREQDIRVDGQVRANARASTPAVRIAFESMHGPLVYATDRYGWNYLDQPYADGWQQNVRAIALGMEALRKVDRYGITKRGEQYRGFKAIGAGGGTVATSMTTDVAEAIISRETNGNSSSTPMGWDVLVRAARANTHPDRNNGDRSRWDAVEQAADVLRRAGRLS